MRHVLLATLGTTPAVLTEAFYYHHRHRNITFDAVHVLTTMPGAQVLRADVLGSKGVFAGLCRDLRVPRGVVAFGPNTIHVFTGAGGAPLEDVRTSADGDALAEQMLPIVRRICADRDVTVHAIASGGRKAMSLYLHAMMQIAGRPQDRLFHLLVHPLIEEQITTRRGFLDYYYPRGEVTVAGVTIPEEAQLACVDLPLLTIEPNDTVWRELPWRELVALRKREVAYAVQPPPLILDPKASRLRIGEVTIPLQPRQFFWYYVVARLAAEGRGPLPVQSLDRDFAFEREGPRARPGADARLDQTMRLLQSWHAALVPAERDQTAMVLKLGLEGGVKVYMSKVGRLLREALGAASRPYEVHARRGTGEYAIAVSPERIRVLLGHMPRMPVRG